MTAFIHSLTCDACASLRPINPAWFLGRRPALLALAVLLAPLSGTARAELLQAQDAAPALAFDVTAQYRLPVVNGVSYVNLEVYLSNTGAVAVVFTNLTWDATNTEAEVAWRQFYPEPKAGPGETILLQLNFRNAPARAQTIRLLTEDGRSLAVKIPAWKLPDKQIEGLAYSRDLRKIFLQYRARKVKPARIWLNGREIRNPRLLRSVETDGPDVAVLESPEALKTGMPLHAAVLFQDGTKQAALVRVLGGIVLDAYCLTSDKDRPLLGLDEKPAVGPMQGVMGGDVACYDVSQGRHGAAADAIIAERLKTYGAQKDRLLAIHYCTARWSQMWDLYGRIADAVYINPYCLSYGADVSRWLDDEEACMDKACRAARPRPWLWIPDCFRQKARFAEPLELETLAWTALAKGCKGLNYFAYKFENDRGFADSPGLLECVKRLDAELRANADRLVPLLPVSEKTMGAPENGLKLYTAWSGEQGLLAVVRNLDYRTDGVANEESPRFSARKKLDIPIKLTAPDWLNAERVVDFRTGLELPSQQNGRDWIVKLEELGAYRVLWLGHGETLAKPQGKTPAPTKKPKWYEFWKKWRRK